MKRTRMVLGVSIVILSNGIALMRVAANRSGAPQQTIELTEFELTMQPRAEEDSRIALRLNWDVRPPAPALSSWQQRALFDAEKLRELGFVCETPETAEVRPHQPLPRRVFVVFEHDPGAADVKPDSAMAAPVPPAGSQASAQDSPAGEQERRALARRVKSRLFFKDASGDIGKLLAGYPDKQKYMIVPGIVRAAWEGGKNLRTGEVRPYRWSGYIAELPPFEIHVPLPFAADLRKLKPEPGDSPRYSITLNLDRDFSPWISAVRMHNALNEK